MLQLIREQTLTDMANAIRTQTGEASPIPVADYADKIEQIQNYENLRLSKTATSFTSSFDGDVPAMAFYEGDPSAANLEEVNMEEATGILQQAFYQCANLTDVNIPKATRIQYRAFMGCTSIAEIAFPLIQDVSGGAFQGCTALETVNIPKLKTINSDAFSGCSSLAELEIGTDATGGTIGANCFKDTALESLTMHYSAVPTLSNVNAFSGTPIANGTGYIYVPSALVDSYKAATNWSTYASQIRAIS